MAEEQARLCPERYGAARAATVPEEFNWHSLLARDGDELETHYRHVLESLGKQKGMLGLIFRKWSPRSDPNIR